MTDTQLIRPNTDVAVTQRLQRLGRVISSEPISVTHSGSVDIARTVGKHDVMINLHKPDEPNAIRELICNKAKLYHELGHVMHTKNPLVRERIANDLDKYRLRSTYLMISNIIEDGRIEHLLKTQFAGISPYFEYILSYISVEPNGDVVSELIRYVRTRQWQTQQTAQFYSSFVAEIDKVVWGTSNSRKVWELSERMVKTLSFPALRSGPCYTGIQSEPEPGAGSDQPGAGSDQPGAGSEPEPGAGSDQPGAGSEPEPGAGSDQPGAGSLVRERIARQLASEIQSELDAIDAASGAVRAKLASSDQPLKNASERSDAVRLASVLSQVTTQAKRLNHVSSKSIGSVNSKRIVHAVTGGHILHKRAMTKDKRPAVCLLVDVSASMRAEVFAGDDKTRRAQKRAYWQYGIGQINTRADIAFSAARVLRSAIQSAGLYVATLAFGEHTRELNNVNGTVPLASYASDSDTRLDSAIERAVAILEPRNEPRKLLIIVTDGDSMVMPEQVALLKTAGVFTVGIAIGNASHYSVLESVCDIVTQYEPGSSLATSLASLVQRFVQ